MGSFTAAVCVSKFVDTQNRNFLQYIGLQEVFSSSATVGNDSIITLRSIYLFIKSTSKSLIRRGHSSGYGRQKEIHDTKKRLRKCSFNR